MNIITIAWIAIAAVAFYQLATLYYRVYMLEKNMDALLDAIERVVKNTATTKS